MVFEKDFMIVNCCGFYVCVFVKLVKLVEIFDVEVVVFKDG